MFGTLCVQAAKIRQADEPLSARADALLPRQDMEWALRTYVDEGQGCGETPPMVFTGPVDMCCIEPEAICEAEMSVSASSNITTCSFLFLTDSCTEGRVRRRVVQAGHESIYDEEDIAADVKYIDVVCQRHE